MRNRESGREVDDNGRATGGAAVEIGNEWHGVEASGVEAGSEVGLIGSVESVESVVVWLWRSCRRLSLGSFTESVNLAPTVGV